VTSRCLHRRTTTQGTNGISYQEKCADCGKLLKKERRGTDTESNRGTTPASSAASSASQPRMTKEALEEFQEYQEFRRWKKSQSQEDE
jgi:hypothetical protein